MPVIIEILLLFQKRDTLLEPAVIASTDPSLFPQVSEECMPFPEETEGLQVTPQKLVEKFFNHLYFLQSFWVEWSLLYVWNTVLKMIDIGRETLWSKSCHHFFALYYLPKGVRSRRFQEHHLTYWTCQQTF